MEFCIKASHFPGALSHSTSPPDIPADPVQYWGQVKAASKQEAIAAGRELLRPFVRREVFQQKGHWRFTALTSQELNRAADAATGEYPQQKMEVQWIGQDSRPISTLERRVSSSEEAFQDALGLLDFSDGQQKIFRIATSSALPAPARGKTRRQEAMPEKMVLGGMGWNKLDQKV